MNMTVYIAQTSHLDALTPRCSRSKTNLIRGRDLSIKHGRP